MTNKSKKPFTVKSWKGFAMYVCELCNFDTLIQDNFQTHMRIRHGVDFLEPKGVRIAKDDSADKENKS